MCFEVTQVGRASEAEATHLGLSRLRLSEEDALLLPIDGRYQRELLSYDVLGCGAGRGGVDREATHPHHERIRSLAASDPTLLGLHAPIELLQRVVGPRQGRYVIAVVQPLTKPAQDHTQMQHRLAQPVGHQSVSKVRLELFQVSAYPPLDHS